VLFACFFQFAGGQRRVDAAAGGASLGFRLLITPGLIALWPVLLRRSLTGDGMAPREHNAHRDAADGNESNVA